MLNTSTDFWNTSNYVDTPLGQFEPAPQIIAIPFDELPEAAIRVLPMPSGTPVSFGHNADLLEAVQDWLQTPTSHYGIMLKAEKLTTVANGDQEVNFMRQAVLRLTFKRNVN